MDLSIAKQHNKSVNQSFNQTVNCLIDRSIDQKQRNRSLVVRGSKTRKNET